ncbi:MAG: precorrin-6y C5,15-methyltransferase (decarboxylating) subunit CbiE [Desulfobacteraceae bacterium]|nr:precorrin-6y C5,15-methyltransferase (decarboxylating) subunit CbiE [Desulfobacteraceae bacterium]
MNLINIIGIGQGRKDLTSTQLKLIQAADLLVGGRRHLEMFAYHGGTSLVITGPIEQVIDKIKKAMVDKKVVVLASGDPLFYGIGSTLARHIDKKYLKIHPNISSMAAAFAAFGEPWHDAKIVSLHGNTAPNFSFLSLSVETKVAFLTDHKKTPGFIASKLISHGLSGFKFCVLENLGDPKKETISWFDDYSKVQKLQFDHPNIVVLLKSGRPGEDVSHETHIGMNDNIYHHSKGLITKSEIRSISLSKLELIRKDHILWDIGSGSGSVALEASFQIPWGQVFAVEKNQERILDIIQNIQMFNQANIKIFNSNFPEGSDQLNDPDRIFIGGGGSHLEQIINTCCLRLKEQGIIVINTVLIQNMGTAMGVLKQHGFSPQMVHIQVSRSKSMPYGDRLESLNPVWIISGRKPQNKAGHNE